MSHTDAELIAEGRKVLALERTAIAATEAKLGDAFLRAVKLVLATHGNVIFCGVGKSGHIGRKLAATFASTGTPAIFVHADEAAHGDLGMIRPGDVFVGISFSGESDELLLILPSLRKLSVPIIAMTGREKSSLARYADVALVTPVEREACSLNLAQTAPTTVTMALGDAIAGALMVARDFRAEDFAKSHPAGALGRRLLLQVSDVMRSGDAVPVVSPDTPALDALEILSAKRMGSFVVTDDERRPLGIFTEGDLCRKMRAHFDFAHATAADIMTTNPKWVAPSDSAYVALNEIHTRQVNQLLVCDEKGTLAGIVHIQDLVAKKIAA